MLIYLDDTLLEEEFSQEKKEKINRAIENILRSAWEGNHLVDASFNVISKLIDCVSSNDCKRVLYYIKNNFSLINYSAIKFRVEVSYEENILKQETTDNIQKLIISYNYFQYSDLLQPTRILAENLNDVEFFKIICNYFIFKQDIGNMVIKFEAEQGGGATICDVYRKHILDKKKFCLAIADNDKRYPSAPEGKTLNALKEVERNGNLFCHIIEVDSHEIENMIPLNYIDRIKSNSNQQKGIDFINNIKKSKDAELLKYFDFKKGISKKNTNNTDYRNYAEKLLPYARTINSLDDLIDKEDSYSVIPPVGKLIKGFNEKPELIYEVEPELLSFQEIEWEKIGSNILYWTCAQNKENLIS